MTAVCTTCVNKKEAQKIAKILIEKKLAACAVMFPVKSVYQWKGKLEQSKEYVLLVKALNENFKKIEIEIKKHHSYKLPCILGFDVSKYSKDYFKWVREQTSV